MENIKKYWEAILGILLTALAFLFRNPTLLIFGVFLLIVSIILLLYRYIKKKSEEHGRNYYPSFITLSIICAIIFTIFVVLCIGISEEWDIGPGEIFVIIIISLAFSVLYAYLYFLPYLIANKKNHPQTRAIYILNIFAGWTIIAWVIALIWANTEPKSQTVVQQTITQSNADELKKYKDLLDNGVITAEEFEAKKKQLLGL